MASFNKPAENDRYRVYVGASNARMPGLIREGCVPMSFAQVMQRRVEVFDESVPSDVRDAWWSNRVDTGDGARRHPAGGLKIAYGSCTLRSLTTKSILHNGALLLTPDEYTAGDGPVFTAAQVVQYTRKQHTSIDAVLENPVWRALARDNTALLREYAQTVFAKYDHAMAIWAPPAWEQPVERLWVAGSLGSDGRGGAVGGNGLGSGGRLVGVAPEAHPPTTAHPEQEGR